MKVKAVVKGGIDIGCGCGGTNGTHVKRWGVNHNNS